MAKTKATTFSGLSSPGLDPNISSGLNTAVNGVGQSADFFANLGNSLTSAFGNFASSIPGSILPFIPGPIGAFFDEAVRSPNFQALIQRQQGDQIANEIKGIKPNLTTGDPSGSNFSFVDPRTGQSQNVGLDTVTAQGIQDRINGFQAAQRQRAELRGQTQDARQAFEQANLQIQGARDQIRATGQQNQASFREGLAGFQSFRAGLQNTLTRINEVASTLLRDVRANNQATLNGFEERVAQSAAIASTGIDAQVDQGFQSHARLIESQSGPMGREERAALRQFYDVLGGGQKATALGGLFTASNEKRLEEGAKLRTSEANLASFLGTSVISAQANISNQRQNSLAAEASLRSNHANTAANLAATRTNLENMASQFKINGNLTLFNMISATPQPFLVLGDILGSSLNAFWDFAAQSNNAKQTQFQNDLILINAKHKGIIEALNITAAAEARSVAESDARRQGQRQTGVAVGGAVVDIFAPGVGSKVAGAVNTGFDGANAASNVNAGGGAGPVSGPAVFDQTGAQAFGGLGAA